MSDAAISMLVLAAVVVLFVSNRLPVEVIAVGSALALFAAGVLDIDQALAGFADPTVILIAALFIVSEGLDATGVTTWVGEGLLARAGDSRTKLGVLIMLLVAGFTALINLNGSVAALLPMVVILAVQRDIASSKLLMPLVFAGSAGSLLLLTGSPVNVVIAEAVADAGDARIGFAEFALVGVPLVAGTIALMLLLGDRLLPDRTGLSQRDLSAHATTLVRQYALDHVLYLRVEPGSTLVGQPRGSWDVGGYPGVSVVTIVEGTDRQPVSEGELAVGDLLSVVGAPETVVGLGADHGLHLERTREGEDVARALIHRGGGVAEVVVPPRSRLVGERVRSGQVIRGGSLVVLAVQRQGKDRGATTTVLQAGDVLLIEGGWAILDEILDDADVLLVDSPELVRRRAVPLGPRSKRAIAVLVVMVVLLASGLVLPVVAALVAAGAMILLQVISVQQAYRRISWTTVLLVAGMIPLSTAIRESGASEQAAELIVAAVGDAGPLMLVVALFLLTATFGQLISNTATALIVIPIAVSASAQLDISPTPVLMAVCVAAAASFLTPVATPANMMIMGPGGYGFGDYWKLGLPVVGLFFVVAVGLVPLIWAF